MNKKMTTTKIVLFLCALSLSGAESLNLDSLTGDQIIALDRAMK